MNATILVSYFFSLAVGLGSASAGLRIAKRHDLAFLTSFSYYLITFTLSGFLSLVGRFLAFTSLPNLDPLAKMSVDFNFGFLIYPFLMAALVFYFRFICGLIEIRLRPAAIRAAWAAIGVFFISFMAAWKYYLSIENLGAAGRMRTIFNTSVLIIYIGLSVLGLAGVSRLDDPRRRTFVRKIAAYYAAVFVVMLGFPEGWLNARFPFLKGLSLVVFYFGANVAPLFVIRKSLAAPRDESSPAVPDPTGLARFCERFGLTPREREVAALLVQGLSYNDIKAGLFISTHTVKNHVHNIYGKCGAKNRYQVLSKIRESAGDSMD